MTDWYFEQNGEQRGPIDQDDLALMFSKQLLPADTRVWTASFGGEWKPASQTPFAQAARVSPPPLNPAPPSTVPASKVDVYVPPYQPPTDAYAYWLAFLPLPLLFLDIVLASTAGGEVPSEDSIGSVSGVVGFWAGLALAAVDAKNLHRSGRNPKPRPLVPFVLLTPIAYFWRRHVLVGASLKFLWIWLACFFVWVVGVAALLDPLPA